MVDNEKESKISWLLLDDEDTEDSKEAKETKEFKEYKAEFLSVMNITEFSLTPCFEKTNNHNYLLKDYLADLSLHATPPELV